MAGPSAHRRSYAHAAIHDQVGIVRRLQGGTCGVHALCVANESRVDEVIGLLAILDPACGMLSQQEFILYRGAKWEVGKGRAGEEGVKIGRGRGGRNTSSQSAGNRNTVSSGCIVGSEGGAPAVVGGIPDPWM